MRVAFFDVTPQLLIEFVFASGYHNGLPRAFFVSKNPLPSDAKIVKMHSLGFDQRGVRIYLESASFEDVDEPVELPPILYQSIYGADLKELYEKLDDATMLSASVVE